MTDVPGVLTASIISAVFSETSVSFCQTTPHDIPKDSSNVLNNAFVDKLRN